MVQHRLVETFEEIVENIRTFLSAPPNLLKKKQYAKGTNFIALGRKTRGHLFVPVKFCGYAKNYLEDADIYWDSRHGGKAKSAVQKILNTEAVEVPAMFAELRDQLHSDFGVEKSTGNFGHPIKFLDLSDLAYLADRTDGIPELNTAKLGEVLIRIGQNGFRKSLFKIFKSCPISGIEHYSLLRASHIKPWNVSSDAERLDPNNGLLLCAQLDLAFDCGLMTFDKNGNIVFSKALSKNDLGTLKKLCATSKKLPSSISKTRLLYLDYHRQEIFSD